MRVLGNTAMAVTWLGLVLGWWRAGRDDRRERRALRAFGRVDPARWRP